MNYQHAFHAGNFADVHKHVVLTRILDYLRQKPAPFRVIDTHAGAGRYDLEGPQATRSGEWRNGIGRVFEMRQSGATASPTGAATEAAAALLAPYLDIVAALNPQHTLRLYPGSPLIIKAMLRRQDRLIACELEPGAAASLTASLRGDARAKALTIDGWMALFANIPPKERRGLVLIDPSYEESADFARRCAGAGVSEVADRTLPFVVSDQGFRWSKRTGAAASPGWRAETPSQRNLDRPAAPRRPARRVRLDRRQPAFSVGARIANDLRRAGKIARANGSLPCRLAFSGMTGRHS
jgi:23S rRNA A2030 N6-methylase RlmJ